MERGVYAASAFAKKYAKNSPKPFSPVTLKRDKSRAPAPEQ